MMLARTYRLTALAAFSASLVACGGPLEEDEFDVDDGSFDSAYSDGKEDAPRSAKFEVFKGVDGRYYFHLLASNGQQVLRSQDYATTTAAKSGIASVKTNVTNDARIDLGQASDGGWYFTVKGSNGEVVGLSEVYSTKSNADRALASVRTSAKSASTVLVKGAAAAFQVFKGLDGQYYFHVRHGNGEILVQSEGYTTRAACVSGSVSVTENGGTASRFEIRDGRSGQAFYVLKASNGKVLAWSEMYATRTGASSGRDAFVSLVKAGITAAK